MCAFPVFVGLLCFPKEGTAGTRAVPHQKRENVAQALAETGLWLSIPQKAPPLKSPYRHNSAMA